MSESNSESSSPVKFGVTVGAFVLLLMGGLIYLFVRPDDSALFLAFLPSFPKITDSYQLRQQLGWAPSLIHVIAFSWLTWVTAGCRAPVLIALLWTSVNIIFELSQLLPFDQLPKGFSIFSGTFDVADIMASFSGGVLAVITLRAISRATLQGGNRNEQ